MPRVAGAVFLILLILAVVSGVVLLVMQANDVIGQLFILVSSVIEMIVFVGLVVVIPVCLFERAGGITALKRSWWLTKGYKWQIFVFIFVLGLIQVVVGAVVGGILVTGMGPDSAQRLLWVTIALMVPFTSIQAVASTVVYHLLREIKEGIDTEELASIFS